MRMQKETDLRGVEIVDSVRGTVLSYKKKIHEKSTSLLFSGMEKQSQSLVLTALQAFANLGVLSTGIEHTSNSRQQQLGAALKAVLMAGKEKGIIIRTMQPHVLQAMQKPKPSFGANLTNC
jgi:hypothetical protein